jgi:hypothetical protein
MAPRPPVLPAARGFLAVEVVLLVPALLVAEATISFLGLGFADTSASWGTMMNDAREYESTGRCAVAAGARDRRLLRRTRHAIGGPHRRSRHDSDSRGRRTPSCPDATGLARARNGW